MKSTANKKDSSSTTHASNNYLNDDLSGNFSFQSYEQSPHFSPYVIQAKLKIGQPNDKYEKEADAMADTVVQKLEHTGTTTQVTESTSVDTIQHKCDECEAEEHHEEEHQALTMLQRKPLHASGSDQPEEPKPNTTPLLQLKCASCGKEEYIQRKSNHSATTTAPSNIESRLNSSKGGGTALPDATRTSMETAFGTDFSGVRIHTDSEAVQMNKALNAKAFTHGSDIYFNRGQYDTGSTAGKHLLAHDLTHTVQQGKSKQTPNILKKSEIEASNEFTISEYIDVYQIGIIYQDTGANIRHEPSTATGSILKEAKQNEKVFILRHNREKRWYAVTTDDGVFGYVADWLVWRNLPEPNAKILKIPSGKSAIGIAKKYYGDKFKERGSDLRFVVNALVYANNREDKNGVGNPGIHKLGGNDQSWATTKAIVDAYIWLPSASFMESLKDKVSSGSISYEIWDDVKALAKKAAFGAAFIGGIIHGAFDGLIALVKGVFDLIWGAIKSIFKGSIWSDLKNIWTAVTNMTLDDWKELFFGWMDPWLEKGKSDDPFTSGHAYGYIAGRILFEIVSLFVGGTAVAKILSKLGKLASKLAKFKIVEKIGQGINKASGKVKEGIEKLRQGILKNKIIQSIVSNSRLTKLSVTDKLSRYVLNPKHPIGKSKAEWFKKALGFDLDNMGELAKQIIFDIDKAKITKITEHGTKYNQIIPITGVNGKTIDVVFGWIIKNNENFPRLVTAIPTKK